MSKSGKVLIHDQPAGRVWQDEEGYWFQYLNGYIENPLYGPISQTLPVRSKPYHDKVMLIPFFDGLIPEGWLLNIAVKNWKLNEKDRMELLLTVCKDCIGAVSVIREEAQS
jgi:serine/threonine-protein kinase HipA